MDSTVSTPKPREQGQIPGKYFRYIFQKGLREGEIKVLRREARQMSNESIGKSWSQTEITREAKAQAAEKRRDVASTGNKAPGGPAGDFMPILFYKQEWRGEADWLKASGPRKQHGSRFSGFSFCFKCPRLGARENCTQDTPKGAEKIQPGEKPALSGQIIRKKAAQQTKNF